MYVRSLLKICWALLAALATAQAQPSLEVHTQARLDLSTATARAGDTVFAGVHLHMDPEWHTYWKNSGDAGTTAGTYTAATGGGPAGVNRIQFP